MRKLAFVSAAAGLLLVLAATTVGAFAWTEDWEGYNIGSTGPYSNWELQSGSMGTISGSGHNGGKCYSIAAGQVSRIRRYAQLDDNKHIVLQGWFKDDGNVNNSSMLGFAGDATNDDNSMIRIGANKSANYQVQYFEGLDGGLHTINTGLPVEAGWHFCRLDIEGPGFVGLYSIKWSIWNAAKTLEAKGEFAFWFAREDSNYVTVGSSTAGSGNIAWDDIEIGPRIFEMSNRSLLQGGAVVEGAKIYRFKTWGWVTMVDLDYFDLHDGSPEPVRVYCPGYLDKTGEGQLISAFGVWNTTTTPPQLETGKVLIQVLWPDPF